MMVLLMLVKDLRPIDPYVREIESNIGKNKLFIDPSCSVMYLVKNIDTRFLGLKSHPTARL